MYCPRCAQQVPLEAHFCKQCGMALEPVKDVVLQSTHSSQPPKRHTGRAQQQGFFLIIMSLIPFLLLMAESAFNLQAIRPSLLLFAMMALAVIGFIRMMWPSIFVGGGFSERRKGLTDLTGDNPLRVEGKRLLKSESQLATDTLDVNNQRGAIKTAELIDPPSVTEQTTELLNDEYSQR